MAVSYQTHPCTEPGCTRTFETEKALDFHVKRAHRGAGPQVKNPTMKCPQCGMPQNERTLPKHLRSVHGVYARAKKAAANLNRVKPQPQTVGQAVAERTPPPTKQSPGKYHKNRKRGDMSVSDWNSMRIPCPEPECAGKKWARSSLSQHLRTFHGIYRKQPRNPANAALVKKFVPLNEYNTQRHRQYTPVLDAHFVQPNGKPELEQAAGVDPHNLAIRIQALIQIAELIVKL